jgi:uncharacterized iron-regulated protein
VCLGIARSLHNGCVITGPTPPPIDRADATRRHLLAGGLSLVALAAAAACASLPKGPEPWHGRLQGDTLALLGEVHDNPVHHRQRAAALGRAFEVGWRPAVVMEQFDLERQADIDRSRRERPLDARHLIDQAGAARGWDWDHYEPLIALALQFELPLWAGNLSRNQASRIMRDGYEAVLGAERVALWGLQRTPDAAWQAAQESEIDRGHCGALPRNLWASMARAQFARDAVLAHLLQQHAAGGAVLLAGNGHVRRDIGVPRWLDTVAPQRVLVVGFVEADSEAPGPGQYDVVVRTARAVRPDPCEGFRARRQPVA